MKTKIAFTLIELLVVIAIIGILSALIVIGMNSTTQKASVAKSQVFANSLRNSLMADMVSEWKLNGGTIGNSAVVGDVLDTWSTNNATGIGTAPGPIIKGGSDCVDGNCLQFDGSDDYVDFGNKVDFRMGTRDHTVSLWVRFDNATAPQGETLVMSGAGDSGVGKDGYLIARLSGTNYLRCYFSDGSAEQVSATMSQSGSLIANTWYNIVVVFDRDVSAQAYINGQKQTGYSLDITPQQGDVQNFVSLKIGAWAPNFYRLAGKMDEVRIFHATATISQIQQNYFAGLNKLFAQKGVSRQEYDQRLITLNSNYAKD